jgi:UDP:flavonoid glycosyltransferase YjiC (YdhE family)
MAAQKLKKRAVLMIGNNPLNQLSEPLPESIIAIPYAPFAKIFPRASVIVHQGGIGTTGQALRAGKPMLVMPYGGDQFDNGARIERLGVGHTIVRKQYQSNRVAARLKQLFDDPSYREKAESLGRRVQAENGVSEACTSIEEQLNYAD